MKIKILSIIVMFLASALILPAGMSYAEFPPGFTASPPSAQTMTNQTSTNQTMTNQTSTNQTMTNQTSTNQTMTMPSNVNQTAVNPVNETMTPTNTTSSQPPVKTEPKMLLPLQQVKAGVAPKDVQCKAGFTLIFKAEDGSPACVDPTVAQILAQRGW